jgi:hypothetical protein
MHIQIFQTYALFFHNIIFNSRPQYSVCTLKLFDTHTLQLMPALAASNINTIRTQLQTNFINIGTL